MTRRRVFFGGLCIASVLIVAAGAWACVFGPSVFLTQSSVKAGEPISVQGLYFRPDLPVVARFNALDGPVVAELGVPEGDRREVSGTVTIPAGTEPGNYVLVFTQAGGNGAPAQVPTRALVTVLGEGGSAPVVGSQVGVADGDRAAAIETEDSSVDVAALLLVGLGTAGIGMFVGGAAVIVGRRRTPALQAEKAQI